MLLILGRDVPFCEAGFSIVIILLLLWQDLLFLCTLNPIRSMVTLSFQYFSILFWVLLSVSQKTG